MPLETGHIQQHGHAQARVARCWYECRAVTVGPTWIVAITTLSVYRVCRAARERIPRAQPARRRSAPVPFGDGNAVVPSPGYSET
jgi:hypothetical protein